MSSSPDLARVVELASPPATRHARADTESRGTTVTEARQETDMRNGWSSADFYLCRRVDTLPGVSQRLEVPVCLSVDQDLPVLSPLSDPPAPHRSRVPAPPS